MTVEAYAKVNLTLEVFPVREDGYHALRSVVLPVSLSDTIEIEATTDGVLSSDTGFGDDLCLKAARRLKALLPEDRAARAGARLRVRKRIPVGGGLGGGSADAAATLRALNEAWGLGLVRGRLCEIAADVGSDVPALVRGGLVLMEGRGERVTELPLASRPALHLVLANPGVFCSTAEVYARCAVRAPGDSSSAADVCRALERGDRAGLASLLANDLQSAACSLHPEIARTLSALRDAGAEGVLMSGSGSTVFGLVPTAARAGEVERALAAKGLWARAVRALF